MPEFEVTSPEGKKFIVTAPKGASQDEVLSYAQSQFASAQPEKPAPSTARVALQSAAKGAASIPDMFLGLPAQAFNLGSAAIGTAAGELGRPDITANMPIAGPAWTQPVRSGLEAAGAISPEFEPQTAGQRVLGRALETAPSFALSPSSGMKGLAGNLAVGAVSGAAGQATEELTGSKLAGTAVSMLTPSAVNAILPPVSNAASRGTKLVGDKISEVGRRIIQKTAPSSIEELRRDVGATLKSRGIDFNALSKDVQKSILDDAVEQLAVTGNLNPQQIARRADIETVAGVGMATRGQIERTPAQWSLERNLQKTEVNIPAVQRGEVPTITGRLQQQDEAALQFSKNLRDKISGAPQSAQAQSPLQASEKVIAALSKADKQSESAVNELYGAYRKLGEQGTHVPDVKIAETLGRVVDDYGVENIPAAVLSRLKEYGFLSGDRTKLLTVQEADKLTRLINNNNPGYGPPAKALGIIKQSINESLLDVPVQGQSGVKALLDARAAAAARFSEQKASKAIEEAIGGTPPDHFFDKYILRGNVNDISILKNRLSDIDDGGLAWNDLRTQVWQWIVDKSTQKGRGPISGARLDDAIKSVGNDRLNVLFEKNELADIQRLQRAAIAMTYEPAHAAVNRSNTAPALLGQVLRFANRIPGANIFTQPIEQQMQASRQSNLLKEALSGKVPPSANLIVPQNRLLREPQPFGTKGLEALLAGRAQLAPPESR